MERRNVPAQPMFEIRIGGEDVMPETVDVLEVLDVISPLIRAVRAIGDIDRAEFPFALTSVRHGSAVFQISAAAVPMVRSSVYKVASVIREWPYSRRNVTPSVRRAIESVYAYCKKRQRTVALAEPDAVQPLVVLGQEHFARSLIRGTTILYGRVLRVGGVSPAVTIRLDDGRLLSCPTTEETVQKLGGFLYQEVGLEGEAAWDPETNWRLVEFSPQRILPYRPSDIDEAIEALARATGEGVWGDDAIERILEWRYGDEDHAG